MPHFWKVRRELRRIVDQTLAVPTFFAEVAWHAGRRVLSPARTRCHPGECGPGADVAIYVLYQPKGILTSTVGTCRHLAEKGYSVRVVSNAPLSEKDRARLAPYCHSLTERPNHGYDFGGYQYAVNKLLAEGGLTENLLLINDSIWFPACSGSDLLDRLRCSTADFSGPVLYRHRKQRRTHLQSYMLHFRRKAIESTVFSCFWRRYRMSSSKRWTIRFGEMRLTSFLTEGGLRCEGLHDALSLPEAVAQLPDADLAAVLRYEAKRDHRSAGAAEATALAQAPSDTEWRAQGLRYLRNQERKYYFLSNHPAINIDLLGFPILKKDRSPEFRRQRHATLERTREGRTDLDAMVLSEIREWDTRR